MTVVACLLAESMFVPRVVSDAPCRHQSARTFQRQTGWSGIPRIVAFRLDILPDRAKKILACVGADQAEFRPRHAAFSEPRPRKPSTSPILTKTRATWPPCLLHTPLERP